MTRRLVQNFGGMRAVVVSQIMPDTLRASLTRLGVLALHVPDAADLDPSEDCDLLIIDGDQGVPGALMTMLASGTMVPVVGLVGTEVPSRLRMLVEAGATAFIRKPVHGGAVYSSLFLAVNAFNRRRLADHRLAEHDRRRRGRRHVVKAILRMMALEPIDDEAAYETLRRRAMHARLGIEDFCEMWLEQAGPEPTNVIDPEKRHA